MSEIRVNTVVAAEGTSAPNLPYGIQVPVGYGITGAGGINISGVATAVKFVGDDFDGPINTGAAATFGGVLKVTDTTNSSGTTNGAIVATGGVGVGKELFVGDAIDVAKDLNVGAATTIAGITKVTDNTSSTSTSTGALIVTGGLAVGGDVFVGAGMSIAGTLTYEDSTNIDSVGLITAQSGIRVPGGQVTVGVAYSLGNAGVCTAAGFVGPLTGNADTATSATTATNANHVLVTDNESTNENNLITFVEDATSSTGNVGLEMDGNLTYNPSTGNLSATQLTGTLQTAAQTNVTSLGTLTGLTISGDLTFDNGTNAGKDLLWDASDNALEFSDSVFATFGDSQDMLIFHDGSHGYVRNTTGTLYIQAKSGENAISAVPDGATYLAYDNANKFETTNDGVSITGMTTTSAGMTFNGMLKEEVNIVANKLSAGTNVDIANGMLHYYTTNETTTATPNIRFNSSYSLNNKTAVGQSITVSIIYKPNNAGYYAALTIDGNAFTEEWNGGDAPSSANSDGYDVLTYNITKTASATFLVLGTVSNFT